MKGKWLLTVIGSICLVLVLAALLLPACAKPAAPTPAPAPAPAQVFKWRCQSKEPAVNIGPTITQPRFFDNVREMSDGRLDITNYAAAELVPTMEVISALKAGTIEMSYYNEGFTETVMKEARLEQSILGSSTFVVGPAEALLVRNAGIVDILREAYAEQLGIYYLGPVLMGHYGLISTKPLDGIDDLKGLKVIGGCTRLAEISKFFGASPTYIPKEERYTALTMGTADAAWEVLNFWVTQKYYEPCPYIYNWWLADAFCDSNIVSLDAWNALPDDLKAILGVAHLAFSLDSFLECSKVEKAALMHLDKYGATLVNWSEEDIQTLRGEAIAKLDADAAMSPGMAKGVEIIRNFLKEEGIL